MASRFAEWVLAEEYRAMIDEAHEFAIQCDEWRSLSANLKPYVATDESVAETIAAVEAAAGIEWGAPCAAPLSIEGVRAAFRAIERGENPDAAYHGIIAKEENYDDVA